MKKLMGLFLSTAAVIALSGCGSSGSGDDDNGGDNGGGVTYYDVHILDLEQGYAISGYSSDSENVTLTYCYSDYDYYRGNEHFYGTFDIYNDEIQMHDNDGGSYVIETVNDLLEVGENYYIWDIDSDITVESISHIDC